MIRPFTSAWASSVVLVRKPDGTIRFCVDYRRLNAITIADRYPLPRVDDLIEQVSGHALYSVIDLVSGFWQIPVNLADIVKTAFCTVDGLFEFVLMPFGLRNAPATFQRLMDTVLRSLNRKVCVVYLDDIIVFSPTNLY